MKSVLAFLVATTVSMTALAAPPAPTNVAVASLGEVRLQGANGTRRFDLVKKLGNGAWSDAYEAKERGTNQRVAIKMLRPDVIAKGKSDSYDKELQVTSAAHAASAKVGKASSLMRIHGVGQSADGRRALVMELAGGEKIAAKERPMIETAQIGMRILRGVRSLHLAGYRHNDLHLGNIAMDPKKGPGSLRILDVGNAIALDARSGANQGGWAPPERYVTGTGARADVYTVGALLYYTSTGTRPDKEHLDLGRIKQPELRKVLARALDTDPQKRFPDAQSFLNALRPLGTQPALVN